MNRSHSDPDERLMKRITIVVLVLLLPLMEGERPHFIVGFLNDMNTFASERLFSLHFTGKAGVIRGSCSYRFSI
jgi:hypothetical protein